MKHVMIDIETLGTRSNSAIVSIAAVRFDLDSGEVGEIFSSKIDPQSCVDAGLEPVIDTIIWLLKQDKEAINQTFGGEKTPLKLALENLQSKITKEDFVWGNSARFDCGLLENAFHKVGLDVPWDFRNERDVRTLVSFAPEIKFATEFVGTKHNAVDDCLHQIKYCSKIWNFLKREPLVSEEEKQADQKIVFSDNSNGWQQGKPKFDGKYLTLIRHKIKHYPSEVTFEFTDLIFNDWSINTEEKEVVLWRNFSAENYPFPKTFEDKKGKYTYIPLDQEKINIGTLLFNFQTLEELQVGSITDGWGREEIRSTSGILLKNKNTSRLNGWKIVEKVYIDKINN